MNLTSLTRLAIVAGTLVSAVLATPFSGHAGWQHEGHKKPPAQDTRPPAEKGKQPPARPGQQQPRTEPAKSDQHAGHATHETPAKDSAAEPSAGMANMGPAAEFLMQQSSGTATSPGSAPMEMKHFGAGSWTFMLHGLAFLSGIQQSGPSGGDKVFSTNWFMGMANREFGRGSLMFRAMLSLDPATVTKRRYPELFQTGETAFGRPIIDGQHPHELFMELSVQYAWQFSENSTANIYFAPVGDPALGPVAFPHRVSAMELPLAPLSHHLQDSTHIANNVVTGGIKYVRIRFEASGFHGAEPGENRWDIDTGAIDSWSSRLTISPSDNWSGQFSVGRLSKPEALEEGDIVRTTASITYSRPLTGGIWASSLIWGRNHKTAEQRNINSYLAESAYRFKERNHLAGRIELVDKDELFADQPELDDELARTAGSVFRVAGFTFGYTRDFDLIPGVQSGVGANVTFHRIPSAIKPFYGDHPTGFVVFLRFRLKGDHQAHHNP